MPTFTGSEASATRFGATSYFDFVGRFAFDAYKIPKNKFCVTPTVESSNTVQKAMRKMLGNLMSDDMIDNASIETLPPYSYENYITSRVNTIELLNTLLPDLWYHGFNRNGKYSAGTIYDPLNSRPDIVVVKEQLLSLEGFEELPEIYQKVTVSYDKNYTALNDNDLSEDPPYYTSAQLKGTPTDRKTAEIYESERQNSAEEVYLYPHAVTPSDYVSHMTSSDDAEVESERILDFMSDPHAVLTITTHIPDFVGDIGDIVELRLGDLFSGDANTTYMLIGYEDDLVTDTQRMRLLT